MTVPPTALTASHSRWERTGSNAGAAVSQTVNGSQIRSTSALLSMLKSSQPMVVSIASSTRWKPDRRRVGQAPILEGPVLCDPLPIALLHKGVAVEPVKPRNGEGHRHRDRGEG